MAREINLSLKDLEEASLICFPKCKCQPSPTLSLRPQTFQSPALHCYLCLPQMFFVLTAGLPHCRLSFACPADDVFLAPENFWGCYKQRLGVQRIVPIKTTKLGRSCKNLDGWSSHMNTLWCFSLPFPTSRWLNRNNVVCLKIWKLNLDLVVFKVLFNSQCC